MDNVIPKLLRKKKLLQRKSKSKPFNNIDEICIESIHLKKCSELPFDELMDYQLNAAPILYEYEKIKSDPTKIKEVRDLTRQYCLLIGEEIINIDHLYDKKICSKCNSDKYIIEIEVNAELLCSNCGTILNLLIGEDLSYSEKLEVTFKVKIDYKKINYFTEWLMQIQGKEKTNIPEEVIETVKEELIQQKIERIDPLCIRKILKLTNNSKYYEHIPIIISKINGLKPLNIPEPIEEIMKYMFYKVQEYWEKDKPEHRKNFFSYPYILHKFCLILGLKDYISYFPLLKSRNKIIEQEIIFEKIVNKIANSEDNYIYNIEWKFIPSV
jgi:hypothetical protein